MPAPENGNYTWVDGNDAMLVRRTLNCVILHAKRPADELHLLFGDAEANRTLLILRFLCFIFLFKCTIRSVYGTRCLDNVVFLISGFVL